MAFKIDFTEWNLLAGKQKLEKQLREARKKKLQNARKPFKGENEGTSSSLGKRKLPEPSEAVPKKKAKPQIPKKKLKQPKLSSFFKSL